jgi:hypothetical protein
MLFLLEIVAQVSDLEIENVLEQFKEKPGQKNDVKMRLLGSKKTGSVINSIFITFDYN